ncbi:MAG: flavodoxin family protein [Sedimentisphaerales bacterium]|nr:flavodoxin family protein [Sedimentisphaerales bacterium]
MDRRKFIATSFAAGAAASLASSTARAADKKSVNIVGVSCSPRKGKTTATSIKVALEAAKTVDPQIETQLLDLGGMNISVWSGGADPTDAELPKDDFELKVLPMLRNPVPDGLIIGSPSYFRSMSALCKVFLDRIAVLRSPKLLLANKPVGVLSVGAYRNGGQELVIEQIQTVMLCHEVMIIGGKPPAHQGATLWNAYNDDIMKDEFGIASAKKLGERVAEAALRLTQK